MAKQYRIIRKIAQVPVTAGGFATVQLPRDYDYESVFVRINGGLQVTALATSVRAEAPCQVVPRLELIADGKNNLFSAPFWFAALGNTARQFLEYNARCVTPPSGVAVATYQVEGIGVIDLQSLDCLRPKDSNFRSRDLSLLELRMTFGQPGDSFVGGTVAFSSMYVDVFVQQLVEEAGADGKPLSSPVALKKVSYQEIALTASNVNQELRLPAGNLIKSVLLRTDGSTTAGEPSTAVLNNLQLVSGVDVRCNLQGANLRAKNNADLGYVPAGYYVADVAEHGSSSNSLSELWDVRNQAEPKLIMDVTGGANVKAQAVVTEYIMFGG